MIYPARMRDVRFSPVVSTLSIDALEEWRGLTLAVACGDCLIPSIGGSIDFELFPGGDYINKSEWQFLISGCFGFSVDGFIERPYGLYTLALELSGFIRGKRKVSYPSIDGATLRAAKNRVYGAACEGVIEGLARYKPAEDRDDEFLLAHCAHWAKMFAHHEAIVIRGESGGILHEAELSQKEAFGGSYSRLKTLAWAYGEAWSVRCRNPTVGDILSVIKERKSSITEGQIVKFLEDRGVRCVDAESNKSLPDDTKDDVIAVYRSERDDVPPMYSRPSISQDVVDGLEVLSIFRDQLFSALSVPDSHYFCLNPDVAEILDIMFFRALPLENSLYYSLVDECDGFGDGCFGLENNPSWDQWRSYIAHCQASVYVPSIVPGLSGFVDSGRLGLPVNHDGEEDRELFALLKGIFRKGRFDHRVALILSLRRAGRMGLHRVVTPDLFKECLEEVREVQIGIHGRGVIDPSSDTCVPVIREINFLSSGFSIAPQRCLDGRGVSVLCTDGVVRPMVSWVRDHYPTETVKPKNPVRRSPTRIDVGAELNRLRLRKELEKREKEEVIKGNLEWRYVFVRNTEDPEVSSSETINTLWGKKARSLGYKIVKRLLPVVSQSDDNNILF